MCCQDWKATLDIRPSLTGGFFEAHATGSNAAKLQAKWVAKRTKQNALAARAAKPVVACAVYVPRYIDVYDQRYFIPTLEVLNEFEGLMSNLEGDLEDIDDGELSDIMSHLITGGHLMPQQV